MQIPNFCKYKIIWQNIPGSSNIIIFFLMSHNPRQVTMCQQLPPRQDLTNTTGALVALCWKSATVADTVARLRQMEEDFTLGRNERLVKLMFTRMHRSLATVHRRYAIYISIPMQGCQKARYLAYTPILVLKTVIYKDISFHFVFRGFWFRGFWLPHWQPVIQMEMTVTSVQI